jgi:tetratricopeptide (TPR) repeat protein
MKNQRPPGAQLLTEALSLLRKGNAAAAEGICRQLLDSAPHDPALHQLAAAIALQVGDLASAGRWADSSLELRPDHVPALLLAGNTRRALGEHARALAFYRRVVVLAPSNPEASFLTCVTLLELGDGEARVMLDRCVERFPHYAAGWRIIGTALQKATQPEAALVAFTREARAEPTAAAHMRRGAILQSLNRMNEAADTFRTAQALEPQNFDAALQLGLCLQRLGDIANARVALSQAVTLEPAAAQGWFALGLAEQDAGVWPAAITAYRAALEAQPDLAEGAVNLGIVLQETGDMAAAKDAYRRALRLRADTFGRIAQALAAAPTGEVWLDLAALRRSLAA